MKIALVTGLEFLAAIGPAKLFTLLSGVKVERLLGLSKKIPQKRMVDILRSTPIRDVIWLIKNNTDENIILFLHEFNDHDLTYLVTHVERPVLQFWINALPGEKLVSVIKITGVKNAHLAMSRLGNEKTFELLHIISEDDLKKIVAKTNFTEVLKLSSVMPVEFVKKFMKQFGTADFLTMYANIGPRNILTLFNYLGAEKSLALLKILGTDGSVQLLRKTHELKLPIPKKEKKNKRQKATAKTQKKLRIKKGKTGKAHD